MRAQIAAPATQNRRIVAGLPFVEALARRMAASMPNSIDIGDLMQDLEALRGPPGSGQGDRQEDDCQRQQGTQHHYRNGVQLLLPRLTWLRSLY